jgi:tetratricopeptide (TPR) repeat protein
LTGEGFLLDNRLAGLMNAPQRSEAHAAGPLSGAEREARIEQLLVSGLDHYFAGNYEQAINIWTRVAFLERHHNRARAYIERARSALAERHRQAEELVHTGVEAYEAGNLRLARELLTRAIELGGANETALVFLERLRRLEVVSRPVASDIGRSRSRQRAGPSVPGEGTNWPLTVLVSAAVAALILLGALPVASWLVELPVDAPPARPMRVEPLPIVRTSEIRLDRARLLSSQGRLQEALRLLVPIEAADPLRAEADRLTAEIQRRLLEAASSVAASSVREASAGADTSEKGGP